MRLLIMILSLSLFGREFSLNTKAVSAAMADWLRGGSDDDDGQGAKLTSPYTQSTWVYAAISRLAEKIASIPFRVSQMETGQAKRVRALRSSADPRHRAWCRKQLGETIIESGAVVDLFNNPHPSMNRQLFWEMVVTWNCLRGEFFIMPLDGMDQPVDLKMSEPRIERLLTLPPEMFWHNVVGYDLLDWRYTGSPLLTPIPSELLLPSEVIHARSPNPYLFWRGLSPLIVAMGPAAADFAASQYNKGYWLNNADTGVIVTTDQQATSEQQKAIMAALRERKRKAGTADRPLFLWGGAKVEKPALTGMEQTMIENRKMNRQEILAVWKVTDSFIGLTDSKSSALSGGGSAINQEEIKIIEGTIQPLAERIEIATEPVVKTFGPGLIGWFDIDGLPIMQAARRERIDSGTKAFAIGASFNDVNRVYDLGFPEYAGWGDKSYLPFSLQEASSVGAEPLPGETDPADEAAKSNPFARMQKMLGSIGRAATDDASQRDASHLKSLAALWKSHIALRRKSVKTLQAKTSKVLLEYRGIALSKLAGMDLKSFGGTSSTSPQIKSIIDLIFHPEQFGKSLLNELTAPIVGVLQAAGNELHQEIGLDDPWKMPPQKALDYILGRTQSIMGTGQTVRSQVNTALSAGVEAGETMDELAGRVKGAFNELTKFEALRVARTETNIAYNDARHVAMTDSGIQFKAWLSSHGPHVRPTHAAAELTYSIDAPIPVDEPFVVGGEELMYPGDDSLGASAGNIINCQCIQLAAKPVGGASSLKFLICGVGEMEFQKS